MPYKRRTSTYTHAQLACREYTLEKFATEVVGRMVTDTATSPQLLLPPQPDAWEQGPPLTLYTYIYIYIYMHIYKSNAAITYIHIYREREREREREEVHPSRLQESHPRGAQAHTHMRN